MTNDKASATFAIRVTISIIRLNLRFSLNGKVMMQQDQSLIFSFS
jgi:hypothetical protein